MNLLTRRNALKLGLAGGVALAASPHAMAALQIVVEGANFQPLPIAIPNFASSDPSFAALWRQTGDEAGIIDRTIKRWRGHGR